MPSTQEPTQSHTHCNHTKHTHDLIPPHNHISVPEYARGMDSSGGMDSSEDSMNDLMSNFGEQEFINMLSNNVIRTKNHVCSHCETKTDHAIELLSYLKNSINYFTSKLETIENKISLLNDVKAKNKKEKKKMSRKLKKLRLSQEHTQMELMYMTTIIECFETSCISNSTKNCKSNMIMVLEKFFKKI